VEYLSKSFVRRVLEHLAIAQKHDPSLKVTKSNDDAGIGFLKGWSDDDKKWAGQLNALLNEKKTNARVLATLAYSQLRVFRDPSRLHKLGEEINRKLLLDKELNPRLNIFHYHKAGSQPEISAPITTQPHGWAWLKYADWNASEILDNKDHVNFIDSRKNGDPHKGTGFKFQGMQQAIKPALYRRDSYALSERETHESGYGGFVINSKTLTSIDQEGSVSVNWRQQNMDKKLPMFSGPSSTTSFMYEVARLLNMPASEAQSFRALLLGWMIQPRDHSFTEIMSALDAYAIEFEKRGAATVESDQKMAWCARENGRWTDAYEGLITEAIDLPALDAKTVVINGQEINLPKLESVYITREAFDEFITQGKGYPSQYASEDYLRSVMTSLEAEKTLEDFNGLASERILYAPQNIDDLKLYNIQERVLPSIPERTGSGEPFLTVQKNVAVTEWLDRQPPEGYRKLLSFSASLLGESSPKDSIGHVFHSNGRNDVWDNFLTFDNTNMLGLSLAASKNSQDPFHHLIEIALEQKTPRDREDAILKAIGPERQNQDNLIKGMMLAVTRFYTANGANVINPGYGDFKPPANEDELEARLQSLLKRNQYASSSDRGQAKKEYEQTIELLKAAIESPMFERYTGKVWHGCHLSVADAIVDQGENIKFPGFMSTTKDPEVAQSYMQKGALLVVKATAGVGADIEEISNAPGEKEVLVPMDVSFTVEKTYTIHLEKTYPPSARTNIQKKAFDLEVAKGRLQPFAKVRVTTPEMESLGLKEMTDQEGEYELSELIEQVKKNSASMEPETKVVILRMNEKL